MARAVGLVNAFVKASLKILSPLFPALALVCGGIGRWTGTGARAIIESILLGLTVPRDEEHTLGALFVGGRLVEFEGSV